VRSIIDSLLWSLKVKNLLIIFFTAFASLLLILEIGLRLLFGFGNPLIYIANDQIGYLLAPSQRTRRYGNRIEINEYSMRSPSVQVTPIPSIRILLLGDSITNGGWWTDQENTISSLMMRSLSAKTGVQEVEVLNASANSWGPRNELAYLEQFGNFNSHIIILIINTDDLFATAPTSLPVGRDRNYPDRKPLSAIVEVFERYLTKPKPIPVEMLQQETGDRVGANLEAIIKIQALASQSNSKFLLVMTPLLRELGQPGSRDYEIKARQRLTELSIQQQITYIDFLPIFNTSNPQALYHDHIHLNLQGNQLVQSVVEQSILDLLGK